jgi:hypothetical protein
VQIKTIITLLSRKSPKVNSEDVTILVDVIQHEIMKLFPQTFILVIEGFVSLQLHTVDDSEGMSIFGFISLL